MEYSSPTQQSGKVPPGTKICISCRQCLSLTEFYFRPRIGNLGRVSHADGLYSSRCKPCYKEQRQARHKTDRIRYHEYLKGLSCMDCGIADPIVLTHDHRNPEEKFMKVSKMIGNYSWKLIRKEMAKCDVVCANCHAKRTAKQQGWYK